MVMIAACRDEGGLIAIGLHQFEAEHAAIETERALKIGHLQMDVTDACARCNRLRFLHAVSLTDRRRVLDAARIPELVEAARNAELGAETDIALISLAIVADVAANSCRPVVGEAM